MRRGHDLVGITSAELDACAIANVVLRFLKEVEESLDRLFGDLDRLEQRPGGIGDAVDAAMALIPARIAQVVLHVADDRVLPIEEVDGAVRADLDGVGPEIRVA